MNSKPSDDSNLDSPGFAGHAALAPQPDPVRAASERHHGDEPDVPQYTPREAEIARLNQILPIGNKLRFDCSDAALEAARKKKFEIEVEDEARRLATENGQPPLEHRIKAFLKRARLRMLRKTVTAELDEKRAALEREEEVQAEVLHRLLAKEADRQSLTLKVERARNRVKVNADFLASKKADTELRKLLLADHDHAFGSNIDGAISALLNEKHAAEMLVAEAPKLEVEWSKMLALIDKEIAELRRKVEPS